MVERDENFAYSVADYTPTEHREDNGNGVPEPHTMALRIVRDRVKEACEEDATDVTPFIGPCAMRVGGYAAAA